MSSSQNHHPDHMRGITILKHPNNHQMASLIYLTMTVYLYLLGLYSVSTRQYV